MFGAKRRVARAAADKQPICGCKHHWSHHDGKGACHFVTLETRETKVVERDGDGRARLTVHDSPITTVDVRTQRLACTCQRYYGPEPLPDYILPPLAQDG